MKAILTLLGISAAAIILAVAVITIVSPSTLIWPSQYVYPPTQPAPCVQPADERIELRGSEDVTSAALEAFYGIGLEGKAQ